MFLVLAVVLVAGCSPEPSPPPAVESTPLLTVLPIEMTVKQRSTIAVPGSGGAALLTIDDITRNQVMTSLAGHDGGALLAVTSFRPGDSTRFMLGDDTYMLTLKELNNALLGQDFATFVIATDPKSAMSEHAKIEWLIARLETAQGAVFIRNGSEHTAQEAADHLRSKWKAAGDGIKTAKQFVDLIASKSSTSGKPYRIRLVDGSLVLSGDYLRMRLEEIE